jgi:3-hydroxyisobutyrate dehydrogenase
MRVGEIGSGTIAKLVHNMISACARMAIAEGMTLGVKAGVPAEALLDALQRSSFGQGRVLREMIPNIVFPGAFDKANFKLELLRKDVGLATELGREYHVPMLIAALAEQQLEEGMRRGWAERDSNALFCLQEERAGVELRAGRV